jgi:ABC-type Mn2+/Zn2+ transport system permease subunit
MDISWADRLSLFHYALLAALCTGLVCPLLGSLLYLRRTSFYGITLPQFATAGVVFGFVVLPWWIAHIGLGGLTADAALSDSHAAMTYHVAWAAVFTFGGLLWLDWLSRRSGQDVGRVAAAFAIASAATILFSRLSAVGASFVEELLQGEVLGVGRHEFETIAVLLGLVLTAFWLFHRDLVFVSYDREMAQVLGVNVFRFETLLTIVTGLTISVGTMTLGPMIVFGLLVLPPLAARPWARSMKSFLILSSGLGVVAVVLGVVASFEFDLPLSAAIVAVAAIELLPGTAVNRLRR